MVKNLSSIWRNPPVTRLETPGMKHLHIGKLKFNSFKYSQKLSRKRKSWIYKHQLPKMSKHQLPKMSASQSSTRQFDFNKNHLSCSSFSKLNYCSVHCKTSILSSDKARKQEVTCNVQLQLLALLFIKAKISTMVAHLIGIHTVHPEKPIMDKAALRKSPNNPSHPSNWLLACAYIRLAIFSFSSSLAIKFIGRLLVGELSAASPDIVWHNKIKQMDHWKMGLVV